MTARHTRWARALAIAVRLGVPPQAFWRLSLVEWRAIAGPWAMGAGLDRAAFNALMHRHPDQRPEQQVAASTPAASQEGDDV